jgi:6-phosphogluconolactonase (cycloisomerase 2 family)
MTQIKVDTIADAAGTGATDFADGITIAGGALSALNTAEYYSSASEPTSPKNGAIWWDTTNEKVMVYIADEFKEVELGASASSSIDISQASYDSVSFSVASQDNIPFGMAFNTDGTKMYICGWQYDSVYQYSLSTGFDLSTASYDSVSFSTASQDDFPMGVLFSPDGTKMYIVGLSNKKIFQYSLTTAYDLSTASYSNISFSTLNEDTGVYDIAFNGDGTKMYALAGSATNDAVFQYSVSTAYNVSTATYDSVSFSVASQSTAPQGFRFNSDGTQLFIIGQSENAVFQYSLSTAFDLSTISYDSVSFSVASQDSGSTNQINFSADYTKLYILGATNDTVYQYSTGL